jgi:hypothetical protein
MKEPKILSMKIYTMHDKPVYYGHGENEDGLYSLLEKKHVPIPMFFNLLQSRDVMPEDLGDLILHDQLNYHDFKALRDSELMPKDLEILFNKIQDLKREVNMLKRTMSKEKKAHEQAMAEISAPKPEELAQSTTAEPMVKNVEEIKPQSLLEAVSAMIGVEASADAGDNIYQKIIDSCSGLSDQEKQVLDLVKNNLLSMS